MTALQLTTTPATTIAAPAPRITPVRTTAHTTTTTSFPGPNPGKLSLCRTVSSSSFTYDVTYTLSNAPNASSPTTTPHTLHACINYTAAGVCNGNITDLVSTNGTSLAHYEFDPYGNTIVKSGVMADANPFRFSSKYYDSETGLYYYGYRYYDPVSGRWVGRDPVGERGGENLYSSCNNSLPNCNDSLGLTFNVQEIFDASTALIGHREYNISSPARVAMNLKEGYCRDGGCFKLTVLSVNMTVALHYWIPTTSDIGLGLSHERAHASDIYYKAYLPSESYAESVAHCYKTREEAQCWKEAAEDYAPVVNFHHAGAATVLSRDLSREIMITITQEKVGYQVQYYRSVDLAQTAMARLQEKESACRRLRR